MAKLTHLVEFSALALARALIAIPSAKMADRLGSSLGRLAHDLLKSRRLIARDNLVQALGEQYTDEELDRIVLNTFKNLGRTMIEIGRFARLGFDGMARLVHSDDADIIKRVYEEGKGAVIVEPHSGNWELLAVWPVALGYPLDILIGTLHNPLVNRMLVKTREKAGVGVLSLAKSMRSAFKSIKAGRLTAITPDQHAPSGNIIAPFFGREASMAKGPALLALRTGCPILPVGLIRESYDRHILFCGDPIYPPNSGDQEADLLTMTKAYFAYFEEHIRKYPDQWMWTHRRWKKIEPVKAEGTSD